MIDSLVSIRDGVLTCIIPELVYPNDNMVTTLFRKLEQWPQKEIMVDDRTGKSWTADQFRTAVSVVAINLVNDFSLVKNDVVCFFCPNWDWVNIGTVAAIAADELHKVVSCTKVKFIITTIDKLETAQRVAQESNYLNVSLNAAKCHKSEHFNNFQTIFVIDSEDEQSLADSKTYPFSVLLRNPSPKVLECYTPKRVDQDDFCVILFSSGTSGLPKPVPRTHKNMLANENCNLYPFDFALATDIVPVPWGLFYSSQMKLLISCLLAGSKIVIFDDTGVQCFCNMIQKYRINKAVLVPTYITQMVRTNVVDGCDLSSLEDVFSTGSILTEEIAQEFVNKFKVKFIRQLYGSTEVSTSIMQQKIVFSKEKGLKWFGIPVPGCSVKIIDQKTNVVLGANCIGELCSKGPCRMNGFLNMPQENKNAFDDDGYYKTGDAAYYDIHGHIFIVDRFKNIFKSDGSGVSCAELEKVLLKHPQIKEAKVFPIENERYGEVPRALVVINHGKLSEADVTDFINDHVAEYKRMHGGVIFVDNIPKSSLGKVSRQALVGILFKNGVPGIQG
ncbi:Luciferin 4-monooxygenase [Pseudolycoriella hygida]|uniref:Luciferin 4-monooxygenase n=1 Tax=Pseudolycoriella hygida TaxID=35572 RepID=A0A9Q0S4S5_9DIPT|nr:Luciferin 4-monooxygenase [Pseudolycoriella hygida]